MTDAAVNFDDLPEHVARYLEGPPVFVPGYHASHIMAAAILAGRLEQSPHLLIVGAGGGVEVARLAEHLPESRFTAVDPAENMVIAAAQAGQQAVNFGAVAGEIGFANRWLLVKTYMDRVADHCSSVMLTKWQGKLGGAAVSTPGHCWIMQQHLNINGVPTKGAAE